MSQKALSLSLLCGALLLSPSAQAWQIEDPLHAPCHERLTQAALSRAGYVGEPGPLQGDDADLHDSVDFDASAYDANIYALSLVLGVRWGDTHGGPDFSFESMAAAANAPDDQRAHCLRRADQDGAEGDAEAVESCRSWIESLYWLALSSLDDSGNVSPEQRTSAAVATEYQGTVYYPLSELYFYAGRALHAVQDSFTHTLRAPDRRIRHVFNWSDQVSCTLDEGRDGHGHEGVLDDCEDGDPSEADRFEQATTASAELLSALGTPGSRAEHAQRIAAFLETWMSYEPGCSLDNAYCDSEVYAWLEGSSRSDANICDGPLGCELAGPVRGSPASGLLFGGFAALALLLRRRRRSHVVAALGLGLWLSPGISHAEDEEVAPVQRRTERQVGGPRLETRASLSVDNPAYAFGVAGLYGFARADVGVFAELNPWYSLERHRMSMGATNFGILAHYLHPLRRDLVLRFGLGVGASVLNTDMLGVNAGNVGVYLNLRVMGLIWEFADGVAVTADPLDLALPAPALVGWPVLHTQHRTSLGLQFSL